MEIESDSVVPIGFINEEYSEHSPHLILIKECKALLAITGSSSKRIPRDSNKVVANMRVAQEDKIVSHITFT